MNTKTPLPTIAELWGKLQKERLNVVSFTGMALHDVGWEQEKCDAIARLQSLRQQLLERCGQVPDKSGYYSRFFIIERTLNVSFHDTSGAWVIQSRYDDVDTAREMSAAYAFWAWELEDREKEANDGR